MHELADRLREQRLAIPGAKLEVKFGVAGLIESATLIKQNECSCAHHCTTRTKIV